MFYASKLGNVRYFDFVLYNSQRCEPSLLFILGLESILNPDNQFNRNIVLYRNQIQDIFDGVYTYLYGTLPDPSLLITSIEFDSFGLKSFINNLTGNEIDKVIPLIYHDSYNDVPIYESKVDDILNIFNFAGYSKTDDEIHYIGTFGVTDQSVIDYIIGYNESLKNDHEKKKKYSQIYKLIDYRAVHQYALGVLYGCTQLGYEPSLVFSKDTTWYDGQYNNLILTASAAFNFNTKQIPKIDIDPDLVNKYKGINQNRIWNYN